MPISFRSAAPRLSVLAAALALAPAVLAQPPSPPSRIDGGETVNVEVKIVPFYAADEKGNPVYDLRPDEIELRVGGAAASIESFDRYVIPSGIAGATASALTPTPSRTVFFLFDRAFSSPSGFSAGKRIAERLVRSWPAGDRLFLLDHGTGGGLHRLLGPVPPDAQGKKEVLAAIAALQPEIRRLELQTSPRADFGPPAEGASRGVVATAAPAAQAASTYDGIQGGVRGEYRSVAQGFAGSLADFAAGLRHVAGPKLLLVFSQGMDDELYFFGNSGFKVGSDESIEVDSRRAPPLVDRFREPLAALADSGTVSVFVNADRGPETDADAVLRDMAKATGGLYLEGRDPRSLEQRIAGSTTAYYEVAFHPAAPLLQKDTAGVEVAVRRPGVHVWAPAVVRTRESYRDLDEAAKRRLVMDILSGGPEAQRAHSPVRLSVHTLSGNLIGSAEAGHPGLRFEAAWPSELAGRKLDVYNVLFLPPAAERRGKILRYERREAVAAADRGTLETALEGDGQIVWGVVAIDPESQGAWFYRLMMKAPERQAR